MEDREILEKELEAFKMIEKNLDDKTVKFYKAIENILAENENLKQALLTNKNLYEEVCNKNKELKEENEKLNNANKTYINAIQNITPVLMNYYVDKSLVKEKIEPIITDLNNNGLVGYADRLTEVVQELGDEK